MMCNVQKSPLQSKFAWACYLPRGELYQERPLPFNNQSPAVVDNGQKTLNGPEAQVSKLDQPGSGQKSLKAELEPLLCSGCRLSRFSPTS
mmetsp:Transcript_2683/g.2916  ORF Transcript_2683/g.2916 Transcript_2683/m.2916 type:complete len:90 (-) Transcript_2683:273-542(-)